MSTESIQAPLRLPRFATLRSLLARAGHSLWAALEDQGRRRSRVELMAAAQRWDHRDPVLAATLRAAALAQTSL